MIGVPDFLLRAAGALARAEANAGLIRLSPALQAYLVRTAVRLQKEALQFTDERSKLEGELLNGIDVVKCNSWEVRGLSMLHGRSC